MKNKNFLGFVVIMAAILLAALDGIVFAQLLVIALAGVFCHYLNGVDKQHIDCNLINYFGGAFANTLGSLGGCVLAVFGIMQSGHAEALNDIIAGSAFAAGYCSDSILNKQPAQ